MKPTLILAFALAASLSAQDLPEKAASVLQQNCYACHGAGKMSGLDLRSREAMLAGGDRGPAVVPGKADSSRLYRFAAGLDKPSMPPGKTLPDAQLLVLREWINSGAEMKAAVVSKVDPAADAAAKAKLEERPITAAEKAFWAFQPVKRPAVPALGKTSPVDAFVTTTLQAKKLKAGPVASRRVLVRRAYLDLWGMPPTPEQVDRFVADKSPNAFAKLVDELLASPHYGERWGRHWLDVVRYADSGGFEYDNDKPNAWRYRDYVVRAFNTDKPYDQFVKEQIAGDEIAPSTEDGRIGPGYLRLGLENNVKNDMTRLDELDDLVATTSNAFMGMTVGCARCHNHKFDPIPQKDYYQMQAVFYPAKPLAYRLAPAAEVSAWEAAVKKIDDEQIKPLRAQIVALEKPYKDVIVAKKREVLPEYMKLALRTPEAERTAGQKLNVIQIEKTSASDDDLVAAVTPADVARRAAIREQIQKVEESKPPMPIALSITEDSRKAPESHFLLRGAPGQFGSVMQPGVLTVAKWKEWDFPEPPADAKTSWRRKGFAEWLADNQNPLTPRVMVNRIWQNHFGEGIVRSPSNFGKTGDAPTHPELLDYLADEFVKSGWSIKTMHRLMMNSETYQRASDDIAANAAVDPENRLLWRMPRRRVEAEVIRDSILAVAGNLVDKLGGPAVFPYIDPALFQSSSKRSWAGKADTDPSTWRRSIYVFNKRSIPLPMLDIFDKPDSVTSCARRNRSTIAPQSLILMNNAFVAMEAEKFAERLRTLAGNDAAAQVRHAFRIALAREPSQQEMERSVAFVKAEPKGLVDLCQTMFNLNEFVYFP